MTLIRARKRFQSSFLFSPVHPIIAGPHLNLSWQLLFSDGRSRNLPAQDFCESHERIHAHIISSGDLSRQCPASRDGKLQCLGVQHCLMPFLFSLARLARVLFDLDKDQQCSKLWSRPTRAASMLGGTELDN